MSANHSNAPIDPELWKLFRAGNAWAFGRLTQNHYRALYNYASKFSQDHDFIRDCIQELFLELWDRRTFLSETAFVKSYLLKALRHKIVKESIRLKRFHHQDEPSFQAAEPEAPIERRIIQDEAQTQQLHQLQGLLAKLTIRQREVVYLRFYQNLTNEEIAQVMDMGRQSVANLLYRTLKELKENWQVFSSLTCLLAVSSLLITHVGQ